MSTTASAQKPGTMNSSAGRAGDSIFSGLSLAAGILIFAVLAAVALFLLMQALPTFAAPADEITGGEGFFTYIWPLVLGTLIAAIIALDHPGGEHDRSRHHCPLQGILGS